jgi:hypothetical protein
MRTCLYDQNFIGLLYYDLLAIVCILYNLTLFYSVSLIYFLGAATAFDIFGTDNADRRKIIGKIWRELLLHYFLADCFGIDFF